MLAERWHWQPSELDNLTREDLWFWAEVAQDVTKALQSSKS